MGMGQGPFGGAAHGAPFADFARNMTPNDLFEHLFGRGAHGPMGGGFRSTAPIPGDDVQVRLICSCLFLRVFPKRTRVSTYLFYFTREFPRGNRMPQLLCRPAL